MHPALCPLVIDGRGASQIVLQQYKAFVDLKSSIDVRSAYPSTDEFDTVGSRITFPLKNRMGDGSCDRSATESARPSTVPFRLSLLCDRRIRLNIDLFAPFAGIPVQKIR